MTITAEELKDEITATEQRLEHANEFDRPILERRLDIHKLALSALSVPADLEGLRQLMEQATPGPWESTDDEDFRHVAASGEGFVFSDGDYEVFPPDGEAGPVAVFAQLVDRKLTIAMRNALPALLSELARLRVNDARYQFLRTNAAQMSFDAYSIFAHDTDDGALSNTPEQVDAAIDAQLNKDTQR